MAGGCQYKRGFWTVDEDRVLMDYVKMHGEGKWNRLARETGLKRGGKSCRLRWMNYLSPNIRRGDFSEEEDDLIIRLHNLLGNRWSLIAGRVPGRTDNQVKNHWNTRLSKKLGIKKGRKKVSASSRFSIKIEGNLNAPSSFNSTPPSTCNEKAREGGSETAVGLATGSKEPTMDGNRQSPFWFSYEDQNQNDYNLMEFLDDFICHGL